jgi:hypothetical protein
MAQATNASIATDQTGTQYRTQDNDRYAAALTKHSGSSRPSYAVDGTDWLDTSGTPWVVKSYDGADDIVVGYIDPTGNTYTPAGVDLPGWGGTSTGAANTYVVTTGSGNAAYAAGMVARFKAHQANTGAATVNVNSLGAKDLRKRGGVVLADGDIQNGATLVCLYDGTNFQVVGGLASQDVLVSGTNIKTINGGSILGSGDLTISTDQSQLQNNTIINAIRLLSTTSSYALLAGGAADAFNDTTGVGTNAGLGYDPTNKWWDATTDANWSSVTALLRLQANATDESNSATSFTATNVTYSTSIYKFWSGSAIFNGTSAYVTNGASQAAYQIGTGSVTIEGWFYPTRRNGSNFEVLFSLATPSAGGAAGRIAVYCVPTSGNITCDITSGSTITSSSAPTLNSWNHFALVRNGASAWTAYLNGTSIGTVSNSLNGTDGYLSLCRDTNSSAYSYGKMNVNSFKFTKGAAVYTSGFTPRTADFVSGTSQSLASAAFTAVSVPTSVRAFVRYQDVASVGITLDTDISVDESRDGGTTWTAATLTSAGAWDASTAMASASVTVSGQPSGTSVKYRIRTSTTKTLRVRGAGLLWS